jgi:hypothetical protein
MEQPLTGTPLDTLHLTFLALTSKIEAKVIDIDDALRELQAHEVVDAAGYTWRIDPMTQAFVRRGPDAGASWRPADPSQFAGPSGGEGERWPPAWATRTDAGTPSPETGDGAAPPHAGATPPYGGSSPYAAPIPPNAGTGSPYAEMPDGGVPNAGTATRPHGPDAPPPPADGPPWTGPQADGTAPWPHGAEPPPPPPEPKRRPKSARRRGMNVAAAAAAVVIIAGAVGFAGQSRESNAPAPPAPRPSRHQVGAVSPSPTVTQTAPELSDAELKRYQPTDVKAEPAPRQILLKWTLPANAQQDGAGIIIRSTRTDASLTTLSRQAGRLPQSYVATPLIPGQRYCFIIGVLLKTAAGSMALARSEPVCATPS